MSWWETLHLVTWWKRLGISAIKTGQDAPSWIWCTERLSFFGGAISFYSVSCMSDVIFNPSLLNWSSLILTVAHVWYIWYDVYIYIYIRVIIPVRRWAKCHACQPKWVFAIFRNVEKLFSHFSLTSSSCQDQMRPLVPHKSCRCYSHFCTTAKHSALTICQAFCAMLQQRELEFFCIWTSSVL